jgi:hypothetical protein
MKDSRHRNIIFLASRLGLVICPTYNIKPREKRGLMEQNYTLLLTLSERELAR